MHGGGCYNQGRNVLKCVNKNTAYIDASYLCISDPLVLTATIIYI